MSRHAEYYEDWRHWPLTCTCGWTGRAQESMYDFESRYLLVLDCPECDRSVLLVNYPTEDQVRAAAVAGNPDAVEQLVSVERQHRYAETVVASRLHDATQLADLPGDVIDVTFQFVQGPDSAELVVLANGQALHREVIFYESLEPLERLVPLLRQRYGDRLRSIDPSGANLYFLGDRLSSIEEMDAILGPLRRLT